MKYRANHSRVRIIRRGRWLGFLIFSLFVLVISLWVLNLGHWRIKQIEVTGTKYLSSLALAATATQALQGSHFGLISKNQFFSYSPQTLSQTLIKKFPRLASVESRVTEGGELRVLVAERTPKYLWCANSTQPPECFLMDDTGIIFERAPDSVEPLFVSLTSRSELVELGSSPFSSGVFTNLLNLETRTKKILVDSLLIDYEIRSLVETPDGDWRLGLDPKGEIIFSIPANWSKELLNLDITLNSEPFKTDWAKRNAPLEYLDLRFGDKIFYRFGVDESGLLD